MRIPIKQQTLFQMERPEDEAMPEYYEVVLFAIDGGNPLQYGVCEYHGFWDSRQMKPVNNNPTLEPDSESYQPSLEDAELRYQQQINNRAKSGFYWALSLLEGTRVKLI